MGLELCDRAIQDPHDLSIWVILSKRNPFVLSNHRDVNQGLKMQDLVLLGQPILPQYHHDRGVRHQQLKIKDGARGHDSENIALIC